MKTLFLAAMMLAFAGISKLLNAQSPNWLWAKSSGGTNYEEGSGVCADVNGNVYVTGFFSSPSLTFGTTTLTNAGTQDVFLVKYDAAGNVLWVRGAGGALIDAAYSVSTDAAGNVYVAGNYESPSITFGSTTLTNTGPCADIFIVKYDANGNLLWAKSAGAGGCDLGIGIAAEAGGSVSMTGIFSDSAITFGTTTLVNAGLYDIFLMKYDTAGNVLWAKTAGGAGDDMVKSVSSDAMGNVYVTGNFESSSFAFGTTVLTNTASASVFLAKYDSGGNVLWAKSASGTTVDVSLSVTADMNGNAIISGYYYSPVITFDTISLSPVGGDDIFIVKYDPAGNVLWARSAGGINFDAGYCVTADAGGSVYITGHFNSPAMNFGATTLATAGGQDLFLVKYDPAGNLLWAKSAGGTIDDMGKSLSTDGVGNLFITGYYRSNAISFGSTNLTNAGSSNMFIAKLESSLAGMAAHSGNARFVIAPNPFTSQTFISFAEEQKNITITVTDVQNRELISLEFSGLQFIFEREELPAGIYFIRVSDEAGNSTARKMVIQ